MIEEYEMFINNNSDRVVIRVMMINITMNINVVVPHYGHWRAVNIHHIIYRCQLDTITYITVVLHRGGPPPTKTLFFILTHDNVL